MDVAGARAVLPSTTRAVVFHTSDDLRLERVPLPTLSPGELLVRIRACGLCPGEAMGWYMARKAPVVLGHEPVGEVVLVGEGIREFAPGDRIFIHHHAPCLICRACRRGDHVHCLTWRRTRLIPGGVAEYAIVPEPIVRADTLQLPAEVSDEAATFIEPLACVVKSLQRAGLRVGDRVAVIGLGVMGMLHMLLARRLQAGLVLGIDRVASRLARGKAFGADAVIDATRESVPDVVRGHTDGLGADVVIVGPGTVEAIELGFQSVAPGGGLVLFSPTPADTRWPLPIHDAYFREVRVIPTYSAGPPETRKALRWLQDGLPVDQLVTHRYSLDTAIDGYRLVCEATDALKVVIRP